MAVGYAAFFIQRGAENISEKELLHKFDLTVKIFVLLSQQ